MLLSTLGAVCCVARGNTQHILRSAGGEALLQGIFELACDHRRWLPTASGRDGEDL